MGINNIPINALIPTCWERIEDNRFYVGSAYAGSLDGSRDTGYLIQPVHGGNGYADNLTRAIRRLRNIYWYHTFNTECNQVPASCV